MKKLFTTFFTIILIAGSINLNAQDIPNGDFENWTTGKPTGWDASNISALSVVTVTQETSNAYSNTSACKIESVSNMFAGTIPGFITLGVFDMGTQSIEGGIAFTYRPTSMKGYYKYQPASGDQAFFGVGISKWNGTSRDTIGQGYINVSSAANTWTPFEVPIDWTSEENPDSLNIIISSSDIISGNYSVGSILWIDDISFDYTPLNVSKIEKSSNTLKNYPNPFNYETNISFISNGNQKYNLTVYNTIGKAVYTTVISSKSGVNNYKLNASNLPAGLYIYNLSGNNFNQTNSMIISK